MGITINGSSAAGNIDLGTNGTITDLAVGGLPDGVVDADTIAAAAKYDDTKLKRDLNILALHTAIDNNKTAHSLSDTFIEQFEDSDKITLTTCGRNSSEYVTSINYNTTTTIDVGFAGGNNQDGDDDQADASTYTGYDGQSRAYARMNNQFNLYEAFNLKKIFAANEDFEVILYYRGTWQGIGYLHGSGITALSQLDYKTTNSSLGSASDTFDGYPGDYYAEYPAPLGNNTNDGNPDNRNLYRFSRTNGTVKIQYYGRSTSDITVDATSIAAVRAATGVVHDTVISNVSRTDKMVLLLSEAGSDSGRDIRIEVANVVASTDSATATCQGSAITASSSRTKVSGVILYKDASGTNTLGTDLKVYFTCNGGTNWTEAASYTAGSDFSTGIKTVHLGETTCTAGTDVRYKVVWANQSDGSKEAQLHGIGVNY